jgi:hypothetical protein
VSPACQICWLTQGSGLAFFVISCVPPVCVLREIVRQNGLSGGTQFRSVFLVRCVLLVRHVRVYSADERACCTISTKTFLVSAGLRTSRKNAMRAPRTPSGLFNRT